MTQDNKNLNICYIFPSYAIKNASFCKTAKWLMHFHAIKFNYIFQILE